ncbi:hypothetical protein [uncultured Tolumonas sp.]|uniref:COG4705 family protein n=1 Tax=uncultured Tolumonas sp. TaxID=263765 RepID=UPI002A0A630F|nr:hypothetical protein [uncultured Tolumonas sp.]
MNIKRKNDQVIMLNKVPEVMIFFWLVKMMSTTVGETAADFLTYKLHMGLVITTAITGVLFLGTLFLQLKNKQYVPWIYWSTVVMISVLGTLITDDLVDNFGVALQTTTAVFSVALLITFALWYASEKTLSIHSINTAKRELYYWTAILFTFALGTSAGDQVAESLDVGYALSGMIFGALIGLSALAYYIFKANPVMIFWVAYILTRPFGASFGDYLSQPAENGGLALGTTSTSFIFIFVITLLVTYMTIRQKKVCG